LRFDRTPCNGERTGVLFCCFCDALLRVLPRHRLFKYIGMVPQMDILIRVLSKAVPSVTIFTFVAIIPVLGLAFSFTAVFGDTLYRYSTVSLSLNTLLRMSVGDFDFEELFEVNPTRAVVMFWLSALLIVFCLINIFVAIILNAYDQILQSNPDANDASQFISMVIMQAKR
jgi:polycystin 1L2